MDAKEQAIHIKDFKKSYGKFQAVKGISFDVAPGEIFGFVGPNGAGKSTTINTLCTIQPKTSGEVMICGYDTEKEQDKVRQSIGVVFQDVTLDDGMTVEETLRFHGDIYNIPKAEMKDRIDFALSLVDLQDRKKKMIGALSGGMKRRVEIARAILHFPKVLFLDEPTSGLDPKSRENVWHYIYELQKEQGTTIFLTTHYMEEAEVCTRMAVIQNGLITALDTPTHLKQEYTGTYLDISSHNDDEVIKILDQEKMTSFPFGDRIRVEVDSVDEAVDLLNRLKSVIYDFEFRHGTLNDVFLTLTSDERKDGREDMAVSRGNVQ
jgi:ABC-2 type transport system ATP-binding protein